MHMSAFAYFSSLQLGFRGFFIAGLLRSCVGCGWRLPGLVWSPETPLSLNEGTYLKTYYRDPTIV